MTDLLPFLQRLGLPQYHDALVNEGFDTWETVLDIQESDLDSLGFRLGHRRKLQRAIAEHRGLPVDKPLGNAASTAPGPDVSRSENAQQHQQQQQPQQPHHHHQTSVKDPQGSGQAEQKRKYRRHPKSDENAPEKPPSGYVLFSNSIREEVKTENLSFTDIAKLAGDRWQKLDPTQKELYENHAAQLKDAYNIQLAEYKKTDSYREYMHYLQQFKVKHEASADTKKPRLEHYTSSSLSATSDGNLSEASHNTASHLRGDSISSSGAVPGHGSQSFLHLSTSLPALHGATGARPSPTSRHVTRPSLMQSSTQSSLSDESSSGRTDVETLQRTANLSLANTASSTPPPPLSGRLHRGDQSQSLNYLSQPWPGWQQGHLRPVLESAEASSHGDGQSRLAKDSLADPRAGTASADDRPYFPAPASQPSAALPMPFPPNHEHVPSAVRRTLPPLLRQSPSSASHLPFPGFGSPSSAPPSAHFPPPSGESLALRQGNWPEPNNSETEAASTLTSLADRRQSLPPFTSSATESPRR